MPGLDTALDTLSGFSRSFFLSYFFPVVLILTANVVLFILVFGGAAADAAVTTYRLDSTVGLALVPFLAMGAAWVISGLTVPARQLLEGEGFPTWIGQELRAEAKRDCETLAKADEAARAALAKFRARKLGWLHRLRVARSKGALQEGSPGISEADRVWNALAPTAFAVDPDGSPKASLEDAFTALETALAATDADRDERLDDAHSLFAANLDGLEAQMWTSASAASFALTSRFVPADLRATRLGNLRAVMEHYALQAYGVEFGFLWPRLQVVLKQDDPVAATLDQAKSQLEFAIVMTVLTAITAVAWLTLLPLRGGPLPLVIVMAAGTPLLLQFFYKVAIQAQQALTETIRGAVDATRLSLLDSLGVDRPATAEDERALWRNLQDLSLGVPAEVPLKKEAA